MTVRDGVIVAASPELAVRGLTRQPRGATIDALPHDCAPMTLSLPFVMPEQQRSALQAAYASPPRAYHNFQHVQEVLRHYHDVEQGPGWRQPVDVALAVLYHDAIYEASRKDNETRSAELA